jgi:hypothetical protein
MSIFRASPRRCRSCASEIHSGGGNRRPEITETDRNFLTQPGGGVTVYLTEWMGARLAADYRSMIDFNSEEKNDYHNAVRVVGGFTLRWGGR